MQYLLMGQGENPFLNWTKYSTQLLGYISHSIAPSDEFEKQELSLRTSTRNFQKQSKHIIEMKTNMPERRSPKVIAKPLKPLKFRSSCDACSTSKVKCDQQRPRCLRCINLGIHCNYSPSRRIGKPPASARKLTPRVIASWENEQRIESPPKNERQLSSPSLIGDIQMQSTLMPNQGLFDPSLDSHNFTSVNWQNDNFDAPSSGLSSTAELQFTADDVLDFSFNFMDDSAVQLPHNTYVMLNDDDSSIASSRSQSHEPIFEAQQVPQTPTQSAMNSPYSKESSPIYYTHDPDLGRISNPSPFSHTNTSLDQHFINSNAALENTDALLACSWYDSSHFEHTLGLMCNKVLVMYGDIMAGTNTGCISPATEAFLRSRLQATLQELLRRLEV